MNENFKEQQKDIFEIVKADEGLRVENCIVVNDPDKTNAEEVIELAGKNEALHQGFDSVSYVVKFPNEEQRLYTEFEINTYFEAIETRFEDI